MKRLLLSLFVTLLCFSVAISQKIITGKIVDKDDLPLIGVNIIVKGAQDRGTLSDMEGKYALEASEGENLLFSYIGFEQIEIAVGSESTIDVVMENMATVIDEIVVVGYGSSKRSDLTGAVGSVSTDELRTNISANIDQALQGRVAGVQFTQNSGQPGGGASIRIRGSNSLSLSNEPLYVIDGVPIQGEGVETSGFDWAGGANGQNEVNPLSTINPADIVSIDILKDASATAIYGSRGANGVVIISTKKGEEGEARISYNTYFGLQQLPKKLEMMDLPQYADYQIQIANDLGQAVNQRYLDPSILGPGTDWQDEIFRRAASQSHQLSVSGGTKNIKYAFSGGYFNQDGIIIGSNFDRISTRLNLDAKVNDWFNIGGFLSFAKTDEQITLNDGGDGVIMQALMMRPDIPVRDVDGNYAGPNNNEVGSNYNPVAIALQRNNNLDRQRLMSNIYGVVNLFKGLQFKSELGFDNSHDYNTAFHPTFKWGAIENTENKLRVREANSFFWINKNYFTYNTKINDNHGLTILLGQEAQRSDWKGSINTVANLPTNTIQILDQGEYLGTPEAWKGANSLLSYYSRVNYNLMEKYL